MMTSKEMAKKLKQVKQTEKDLRLLKELQKVIEKISRAGSAPILDIVFTNTKDKFADSFAVAIDETIKSTERFLEWQ